MAKKTPAPAPEPTDELPEGHALAERRVADSVNIAAHWVPLDSLIPWAKNPRKNDEAVPAIAESIKRFGFTNPLLARAANREIIGGHTRAKAAGLLATMWAQATERERATWSEDAVLVATKGLVPVRFMDLSEHDAHLCALADNRLGEKAEWDTVKLHDVMTGYDFEDISVAGWNSADLDAMASAILKENPASPNTAATPADGESLRDIAKDEWQGMPEFGTEPRSYRSIVVHLQDEAALHDFEQRMGQKVTEKAKYIWHPHKERQDLASQAWVSDPGGAEPEGQDDGLDAP